MKLTQRAVGALAPDNRDRVEWDDGLPGFGVRIKISGHKSFVVQYRRGAVSRRMTIGPCSTFKLEQARKRARKILVEAQDGGDPAADRKSAMTAPTVAGLAHRYLTSHAATKKKRSSYEADERNLRLHVLPALGRKMVAEITSADVSTLQHDMKEKPGAANRVLALLSKMFNLAEKWRLRPINSNPCRHVERYPGRDLERFLSRTELTRLGAVLSNAQRTKSETDSAIAAIRLLIFTGARRSEILTLRWEYVDIDNRCLRLPVSKTGAKVVYLPPPALEVISGLKREKGNPFVIVGSKTKEHLVNIQRPWLRIRKAAKLDDVRIHDLRHSFASVAAASGLGLPIIGALLGHSDPATTQRYAHLADDPLREAADQIGERIEAAMKGKTAEVVALPLSRS